MALPKLGAASQVERCHHQLPVDASHATGASTGSLGASDMAQTFER